MCQFVAVIARRCRHRLCYTLANSCNAGFDPHIHNCRCGNHQVIRRIRAREIELCDGCQEAEQEHIIRFYTLLRNSLEETARRENWPEHSINRLMANLAREEVKESSFYAGAGLGYDMERIADVFATLERELELDRL